MILGPCQVISENFLFILIRSLFLSFFRFFNEVNISNNYNKILEPRAYWRKRGWGEGGEGGRLVKFYIVNPVRSRTMSKSCFHLYYHHYYHPQPLSLSMLFIVIVLVVIVTIFIESVTFSLPNRINVHPRAFPSPCYTSSLFFSTPKEKGLNLRL